MDSFVDSGTYYPEVTGVDTPETKTADDHVDDFDHEEFAPAYAYDENFDVIERTFWPLRSQYSVA